MRRTLALIGVALALAVSTPALAQAPEQTKLTIGVGGKSLFYYLPLTIAERKGYFKDEGLEVEIPDFPGGAKALQALIGGSADLVSGAYEHTIGVTAPGSSTNMFVNILLAKVGLKPDVASYIGVGAGAGAVAIMKRGEIDAIANLDPVIATLEANGDAVAVVDTRTTKGMLDVYGPSYAAGCIYAQTDFIKKNPRTMQAVVNAMVRALRFIQTSTPEQIVATVPPDYYSDKAIYTAALKANSETFKHDGAISMEAAQAVYRDLKSFDPGLQNASSIDLSKTFDMQFQQKAAQKFK